MEQVVIREAYEEDLPAILSLYGQIDMNDGQVLTLEQARAIFARFRLYPNYRLYVATLNQDVVGTFALLIMDNLAHQGASSGVVEDVVVHSNWQGQGIGQRMMEFAIARCREAGCYKLALSSNLKREAAHRFYEGLDFQKHGYSFIIPTR